MAYNYDQINFPSLPQEHIPAANNVVVDPTLKKYGAAADAYVTGNLLRTKLDGEAITESESLMLVEGKAQLDGFNWADEGSVPHKENGRLNWRTLANVTYTGRYTDLVDAPTKLSQFENDVPYAKSSEVTAVLTDLNSTKVTLDDVKRNAYGHIINGEKHVSTQEREQWNNAVSEVSNLNARLTDLDSQVQEMDTKVTTLGNNVSVLQQTVNTHDQNIDALNSDMLMVATTITQLNSRVTAIETDVPSLKTLEPRVNALEEQQAATTSAIASINELDAKQNTEIDELYRLHHTQAGQITAINTAISDINSTLDEHSKGLNDLTIQLKAEEEARKLVDGQLSDKIDTEIAKERAERTLVDGQLADRITSEVAELNNKIAKEAQDRYNADVVLEGKIGDVHTEVVNEANTRALVDGQLSDAIKYVREDVIDAGKLAEYYPGKTVAQVLKDEETNRAAADADLRVRCDANAAAIAQEVEDRKVAVKAEEDARIAADKAEEDARIAADATKVDIKVINGTGTYTVNNTVGEQGPSLIADNTVHVSAVAVNDSDVGGPGAQIYDWKKGTSAASEKYASGTSIDVTDEKIYYHKGEYKSYSDRVANAEAEIARIADINAEKLAREAADIALGDRITNEIAAEKQAREDADALLEERVNDKILAEESRAKGAEETLSNSILQEAEERARDDEAEKTAREAADKAEENARIGADTDLRARCDKNAADIVTANEAIAFNKATIDAEILRSTRKDTELENALNTEITRATTAETTLSDRIDTTDRNLTQETEDRQREDAEIRKLIEDLGSPLRYIGSTTNAAGETPLRSATRYGEEWSEAHPESSLRNGDVCLVKLTDGTAVEFIYYDAKWEEFGNQGIYATKAELAERVSELQQADSLIRVSVANLTTDLSNEVTARTNADNLLTTSINNVSTKLDNEILDRTNADNLLRTSISDLYVKKQDVLTAGTHITIENNTISTDATRTQVLDSSASTTVAHYLKIDDTEYRLGGQDLIAGPGIAIESSLESATISLIPCNATIAGQYVLSCTLDESGNKTYEYIKLPDTNEVKTMLQSLGFIVS